MDLIGAQKFEAYDNMYKIVDFLNRNLRKHNLMFGLSKEQDAMTMTIYEVE
ncbi:MAG: YpmA family protein [Peptococcaceae bacterium]|nr:YpmA family protein [Peptococcaceae bacterium]